MISALIMTAITSGGARNPQAARPAVHVGVDLRYYAFAVFAPVGMFAIAVMLNRVIAGAWPDLNLLGEAYYMASPWHSRCAHPIVLDLRFG